MTPEQTQEFKTNLQRAESLSVRVLLEDREDMWREPRSEAGAASGVAHPTGSLAEIREALLRIENGVFGVCTSCGKAVDLERLRAMPWTPLCAGCEESGP